jgi:hypothetical protein
LSARSHWGSHWFIRSQNGQMSHLSFQFSQGTTKRLRQFAVLLNKSGPVHPTDSLLWWRKSSSIWYYSCGHTPHREEHNIYKYKS